MRFTPFTLIALLTMGCAAAPMPTPAICTEQPEEAAWSAVAVGLTTACGIAEGQLSCWGRTEEFEVPAGDDWTALVGSHDTYCATSSTEEVVCFGNILDFDVAVRTDVPASGSQIAVADGGGWACVTDGEQYPECWGGAVLPPPGSRFATVTLGVEFGCGLDLEGDIGCWSAYPTEAALPEHRPGPWRDLAVGSDHTCALDEDGAITCWGDVDGFPSGMVMSDIPAGHFERIRLGGWRACALDDEGALTCWGEPLWDGPVPTASDRFTEVAMSDRSICGIDPDGALTCWGQVSGCR